MRHVDEGTIHAWLDEQITDPAEAAWIETHVSECAECRARLADEQAAFDSARTLLDGTALTAERPSFEALAAKAGLDMPNAVAPATQFARPRRERLVQLTWAASLALAVGLGWTARELTDRDQTQPVPAPAIADASPAGDTVVENRAPARAAPTPGAAAAPARATAAPAPSAPQISAPAPQSPQMANADAAARRSEPRSETASAAPAPQGGALSSAESVAQLAAPPAVAAPTAPPPAAAAPAASAAEPVGTPASLAPSRLESIAIDGQWRPVPRTEAAARTGMPLYGVDGLEPQYTGLSADGTVVRTLYRLASGAQVELLQQRNMPGDPPVIDVQSTRRALASGQAGAIAGRQSVAPPPVTVVRDNMRLTLQTTAAAADLPALSLRLRVD